VSKRTTQVNLTRLIEILGRHLYSKPEICIRELIQNAHDSLIIRLREHPQIRSNLEICVKISKDEKTLSSIACAIGMTLQEIDTRLLWARKFRVVEKYKGSGQLSKSKSKADLSRLVIVLCLN
jgi:HSP90 family molecular chaperone